MDIEQMVIDGFIKDNINYLDDEGWFEMDRKYRTLIDKRTGTKYILFIFNNKLFVEKNKDGQYLELSTETYDIEPLIRKIKMNNLWK